MSRSSFKFPHRETKLSWFMQTCYLIWSLKSMLISHNFNSDSKKRSRNASQDKSAEPIAPVQLGKISLQSTHYQSSCNFHISNEPISIIYWWYRERQLCGWIYVAKSMILLCSLYWNRDQVVSNGTEINNYTCKLKAALRHIGSQGIPY